ncbi:cobalt-precorrin-6A reductase [Oceanibium sediminis]|uniref:cobalt-precorrin-6A reductase n=1 Tax=Oceanibium sediminis TaxID=2026339 RepID=UPI000DD3D7C4|nr:cobalt-precorrin-6A reductase [Oceanibium sediminis]
MPDRARRLLLLGGTAEARALGAALADAAVDTVTSLAGVTAAPLPYTGELRRGGFGGVEGMAAYLREQGIGAIIDATHPFAEQISANAVKAAARAGVPLARLARPPWRPGPGARWRDATDIGAAIGMLPTGAHGFLAAGVSAAAVLPERPDICLTLRAIEPPDAPLPQGTQVILARPPYDRAGEETLFARLGVTHLICKNAGGRAGRAKLEAAAKLGIAVLMIPQPRLTPADAVLDGQAAALAWARAQL